MLHIYVTRKTKPQKKRIQRPQRLKKITQRYTLVGYEDRILEPPPESAMRAQ